MGLAIVCHSCSDLRLKFDETLCEPREVVLGGRGRRSIAADSHRFGSQFNRPQYHLVGDLWLLELFLQPLEGEGRYSLKPLRDRRRQDWIHKFGSPRSVS